MNSVFIDTNVVLDFTLNRDRFAKEAAIVFDLAERKKITLNLSSLSINNIDYIISKLESKAKSRKIILKLISLVNILPVGDSIIKKAAISDFSDFEDAIQNFCAEEANLNVIITRNVKDYKKSALSILTPKEFLLSNSFQETD